MVLETDLDYLVGEAEHDGMLGAHPLLNIDDRSSLALILHVNIGLHVSAFPACGSIVTRLLNIVCLEVRSEMLKEGDLLLKLLGEVAQAVGTHDVLLLSGANRFALIVVELASSSGSHGDVV